MDFESALVEEFGTGTLAGKVFPLDAPEGTVSPYLVYLSDDGVPIKAMDGFSATKEVDGELNIIHSTYNGMKALEASVLTKLRSFEGRNIGTSGTGPFIQSVNYDDPVELFEPEIRQYRCVISFEVYF